VQEKQGRQNLLSRKSFNQQHGPSCQPLKAVSSSTARYNKLF